MGHTGSFVLTPDALHRFSGKVEEWDGMSKHLVVYDDGDEEWLDLAVEKIKLHTESGESHIAPHKRTLVLPRLLHCSGHPPFRNCCACSCACIAGRSLCLLVRMHSTRKSTLLGSD